MFVSSTTVQTYKFIYDTEGFKPPGRTFFHQNKCKCVALPTTQSCVDIYVSSLQHYMRALDNFLSANWSFKRQLYRYMCPNHKWVKLLKGTVESLVKASCFPKKKYEHLTVGVGKNAKNLSFFDWRCVNGECKKCSVDKKLGLTICPIWNNFTLQTNVLEWFEAPRQGFSNGKQNTQLEVGTRCYQVTEVLQKLTDTLNVCCTHQASYKWKGWMQKVDMVMSNADKHCVICTDFRATLDLCASKKYKCSFDNHAILCIFFVLTNWRKVKYKIGENEYSEIIINDCNKFFFWQYVKQRKKKQSCIS